MKRLTYFNLLGTTILCIVPQSIIIKMKLFVHNRMKMSLSQQNKFTLIFKYFLDAIFQTSFYSTKSQGQKFAYEHVEESMWLCHSVFLGVVCCGFSKALGDIGSGYGVT